MKNKLLLLPLFLLFSLSFLQAFAQENFNLNSAAEDYVPYETKLPRGASTVSMNVQLAMPVSETTVPFLYFNFPNKQNDMALLGVNISDEVCTGEYSTSAQFYARKHQFEARYFSNKIPWPETIPIKFEVNKKGDKGYHHEMEVYGETQTLYTAKKLTKIVIDIDGMVEIHDFQVFKEK